MLYIVGLGLNEKGICVEGLEAVKKCKSTYLESYTVEFPYSIECLEGVIGKKIISLSRDDVESDRLIKESRKKDICLLVYGSPLFATTHVSLIDECKDCKVKVKVIHSSSVFDAIADTGLQLYKFGKISSMPKWQENFRPDSFLDFVEENKKIFAHSLILVDIGLGFEDALDELIEASKTKKIDLGDILVCSRMGTSKAKVFYGCVGKLKLLEKKVFAPFCFIIPEKMHFLEENVVKDFSI